MRVEKEEFLNLLVSCQLLVDLLFSRVLNSWLGTDRNISPRFRELLQPFETCFASYSFLREGCNCIPCPFLANVAMQSNFNFRLPSAYFLFYLFYQNYVDNSIQM